MQTESTITVENARATVLARYYFVLGLKHAANHNGDREQADKRQGELLGLAYALGALGFQEDLPQ